MLQHLVKFPALNLQVRAEGNVGYGTVDQQEGATNMGCHVRLISGISLICRWNTLETMDGTKLGGGVVDKFTGMVEYKEHVAKAKASLADYRIPENEKEELFQQVVKGFNLHYLQDQSSYGPKKKGMPLGPSIVLMSDNVNSWTPEFRKSSGIPDPNKVPMFKTSDFALWLVKKKVGIVMGSPIGRNQFHQDPLNYSMVQAWVWIPPNFAKHTVPGSHFVSGLENQPTKEQWYSDTKKAVGKEDISDKELDARLWREGEFNSHLKYVEAK